MNGLEGTVDMFQQEIVNVKQKVIGVETKVERVQKKISNTFRR